MQVRDVMTKQVIHIGPEESVAVAARTLEHYNIGILPVCGYDGQVRGLITDRDLVTRCLAVGGNADAVQIGKIMSKQIIAVQPDADTAEAASIMKRRRIRRLPVMENGKLCGMVSLGDLVQKSENESIAAKTLAGIVSNVVQG